MCIHYSLECLALKSIYGGHCSSNGFHQGHANNNSAYNIVNAPNCATLSALKKSKNFNMVVHLCYTWSIWCAGTTWLKTIAKLWGQAISLLFTSRNKDHEVYVQLAALMKRV